MSEQELTNRDWFGNVSGAVVLGFTLTIALTSTFGAVFSTGDGYFTAQGQLAMWLASPVWCVILGFCFLFRNTARAWAWLGAANILVWALYAGVRILGQ